MKVGYIRVSSSDQNTARQEASLREYGCEKVYIDKCSGKNTARPKLTELRGFIREGDIVVVSEYSRLARSVRDLLNLVDEFTAKGVAFISLKENFDTTSAQGKLMLTIFAGLAEFEREMILSRQREGIAIAKQQGKYRGRSPMPYDEGEVRRECKKWRSGNQTAVATMKILNMKPNRFYRIVKELGL